MGYGRRFVSVLSIAAILAMAGCGGGGEGTSATSVGGSNVTIQGVVPGTVFVAVDNATNAEVQRATGSGSPKTFAMTIPTGRSYRFYLVENENSGSGARVYPYYAGTTNVFEMTNGLVGQTIDLGTVAPNFSTGNASSTGSIMGNAGVMGGGANAMMPPTLAGAMFSADNLAGTWHFNTLAVSGTMGWTHGTLAIDNAGMGSMTGAVRNGIAMPSAGNIPYTMSQGGMIHRSDDNTFGGVMSKDFSLMAATFTDNTGGFSMMIAQRRSGSYALSDMDGTWRFHRMTAGSDNVVSGWANGTMTVSGGFGTIISIATSSGSTAETGRTMQFAMGIDGIVAMPGNRSFDGAMSVDKQMVAATDNTGSGSEMWLLMKAGGSFGMTDLAGDWMINGLDSGNPGVRDWTAGQAVIGSGGQMSFPEMTGPAGMMSFPQLTLTMNPDGTFSSGGSGMMGGGMGSSMMQQTYAGSMNGDKNLMVTSWTDGSGGYGFSINMK